MSRGLVLYPLIPVRFPLYFILTQRRLPRLPLDQYLTLVEYPYLTYRCPLRTPLDQMAVLNCAFAAKVELLKTY